MSAAPPTPEARPLPKPGDVIDGKYTLEGLLGKGGMGAVYAARHNKLGHRVAIKVMLAEAGNQESAQRFVNEGRAAANIQNEHVVRVFDVDEENGYAFMVLELLEGHDLAQVLDRMSKIPPHQAVGYVLQALDGVSQAHALGIIHRDLKPSNLFLATRQNGSLVVKVLDFGISKANTTLGQAPGALTSTKAMLGSPLYMSPEQLRSSKNVDVRADIWAMGVILFELMTGRLPFSGDNLGELFAAILETEPPPLRALVPEASAELEAIVARCLQRRPEHRFQNVEELARELAPHANATAAPFHGVGRTAMLGPPAGGPMRSSAASASSEGQRSAAPDGRNGPSHGGPSHVGSSQGPVLTSGQPPPSALGLVGPGGGMAHGPAHAGLAPYAPHVHGTVPLGAVTPQPQAQTNSTWQNPAGVPARSNAPIAIVVGLALLVLGGGSLALVSWRRSSGGTAATSATTVPGPSSVAAGGAPLPGASPAASTGATAPSASNASPATGVTSAPTTSGAPTSASSAVPVAVAASARRSAPAARPEPPKPEPPKADAPKPVAQPARPAPSPATPSPPPAGDVPVQGSR